MLGADVSSLQRSLDLGTRYHNVAGSAADPLDILKGAGVNRPGTPSRGNGWDPADLNGTGNQWDNMAVFNWTGGINPNVRWTP